MGFYSGQEVLWLHTLPGGWNWTIKVPAKVVEVTKSRVKIEARTKQGTWESRTVKQDRLIICPTTQQIMNELMVLG